MRKHAVSTLFLVLALVTGACAGRQVRSGSIPVPPRAETAVSEPAPAPVAEAPDAVTAPAPDPAPVQEAAPATPVVTETPAMAGARMIAEHNASVRAAAEKLHSTPMPPRLVNEDEIVAALRIDPARIKAMRRMSDARFAAFWREMNVLIAKYEAEELAARKALVAVDQPRPVFLAAPAAEDEGRVAVVGALTASPPITETPAPAGPSILPAPQGGPTATAAGPAKVRASPSETVPLFVPDRATVLEVHAFWSAYLIAVTFAVIVGVFGGLLLGWRRDRRLTAIASAPYDHVPDGTILMQEVVGGHAVMKQMFPPDPLPPRSEPEADELEAQMDSLEVTWHAQGDAIADDGPIAPSLDDAFDHSDVEFDPDRTDPGPPPAPFTEPDTIVAPEPSSPHVQPESDAARFAAGSGKIVTSDDGLTASGDTPIPASPPEPRSEPVPLAKVILYEDESSNPGLAPASTPN